MKSTKGSRAVPPRHSHRSTPPSSPAEECQPVTAEALQDSTASPAVSRLDPALSGLVEQFARVLQLVSPSGEIQSMTNARKESIQACSQVARASKLSYKQVEERYVNTIGSVSL